ncbi:hypothetical protein [Pseudemcibacter aquimaris]|uniref:hypothetical protein n=1 Tax=Pseudemcibacter aquimaris TaxID=2857064 RepID=UPI002011AFAE|nr:hypothetical protein [Pseudemcibacter aquimaris]MCC3861026.1 hypothetical protein [Pseudemcibacter aquimaris]WDU59844.1 hypothetical protein KW060_06190 [Pseudemcibacter aquimaris]
MVQRYPKFLEVIIKLFYLFLPIMFFNIFNKYKEITFEYVCESDSGYRNNATKITSILNWNRGYGTQKYLENTNFTNTGNMLRYIVLHSVEFVEFVVEKPYYGLDKEIIEAGNYRAKYYPEDTFECLETEYMYPNYMEYINESSKRFKEHGFPLKDTSGKCIGIEKVDKLEAKYQFRSEIHVKETSSYGHSLNIVRTRLINRESEGIVNQFQNVSISSNEGLNYLFLGYRANFYGNCNSLNRLVRDFKNNRDLNNVSERYIVERGFFDFGL